MPVSPKEFLDVARKISPANGTLSEAETRTAHGRAYYAAYLTMRDRLTLLRVIQPSGSGEPTHKWLINTLKSARNNDDLLDIAKRLASLLAQRTIADYELERTVPTGSSGYNETVRAETLIFDFNKIDDVSIRTSLHHLVKP